MTLGERLRKLRGKMKQVELSRRSGISKSMISQIEHGERVDPSISTTTALEHALGIPHGSLSAPEINDPSLARFRESDFYKDLSPSEEEMERLRVLPWKPATDDTPPSAWANILKAIRKNDSSRR